MALGQSLSDFKVLGNDQVILLNKTADLDLGGLD